jgi:hypothetical protein
MQRKVAQRGVPILPRSAVRPFSRAVSAAVIALAILTLAAACTRPVLDSGVEGEVRIGPISPVEHAGVDNTAPYSAKLVVREVPAGKVVAEVTSGADGRFRILLVPGDYVLEPAQGNPLPLAAPVGFTVVKERFASVTVDYDSGIR